MDPALVAPGGLAGKSVALTGFPALERILYDDDRLPAPGALGARPNTPARWRRRSRRNLAAQRAGCSTTGSAPAAFASSVLTAAAGNDIYHAAEEASADC